MNLDYALSRLVLDLSALNKREKNEASTGYERYSSENGEEEQSVIASLRDVGLDMVGDFHVSKRVNGNNSRLSALA